MGYICIRSLARHIPGTKGELKRSLPRTLAPLSPTHPRRCVGGGGGAVVTNDWCIIILKNHAYCLVNLNMKHDQSVMDVIPCSFQSRFRHLLTRGLWKTNPCQNHKYALTYFHIRFLFEVNLHKVKRTDNIYRMFQDSVYINCLQY